MDLLLKQLLEHLEKVGDDHEEVYDTDVRENMRAAVTDGVLAPIEKFILPDDYSMYSAEGNQAVQKVLAHFIPLAIERMQALGLDTFHKRLAAFQNEDVQTEQQSTYDEFFGWAKPEEYDAQGNWLY